MEDTVLEGAAMEAPPAAAEGALEEGDAPALIPEKDAEESEKADYEAIARADLADLKEQFPALGALASLTELPDPLRYAELRELGLSPREAYLATGGIPRKRSDNRAHLFSSVPRTSARGRDLPSAEQMAEARRLFSDLNDTEIYRLYKKVSN